MTQRGTPHYQAMRLRQLWGILTDAQAAGQTPTVRMIAVAMGLISNDSAWSWLRRLEATGYISVARKRARAITVLVPLFTVPPRVPPAEGDGRSAGRRSETLPLC
ncbi:MAG: hypothetical protein FJ315_07425 [SAR202 cluster bacterium]|nr:hypothetical protein [SAR202 cluster bacterium]